MRNSRRSGCAAGSHPCTDDVENLQVVGPDTQTMSGCPYRYKGSPESTPFTSTSGIPIPRTRDLPVPRARRVGYRRRFNSNNTCAAAHERRKDLLTLTTWRVGSFASCITSVVKSTTIPIASITGSS